MQPEPKPEERIIQCTDLGEIGRFGNQMGQYAVALAYARLTKSVLQVPKWIGQDIFEGLDDPQPDRTLPQGQLDVLPWPKVNVDLHGWFRYQDAMQPWSYAELKKAFRIRDKWKNLFPKRPGRTVVAHVRRGDYLNVNVCLIDVAAYWRQAQRLGIDPQDIVWVSDSIKRPQHPDVPPHLDFLGDFMELVNADVILRANSSFSYWGAALSNAEIWSPVVDERVGFQHDIPWIRGNSPKTMPARTNIGKITDVVLRDDQAVL